MTQLKWNRYRWMRRVAIVLAAAPLFQASQCSTGLLQVMRTSVNQAPSSFFQTFNGLGLYPLQLLLGGGNTGQSSGTGTGTSTGTGIGTGTGTGGIGF